MSRRRLLSARRRAYVRRQPAPQAPGTPSMQRQLLRLWLRQHLGRRSQVRGTGERLVGAEVNRWMLLGTPSRAAWDLRKEALWGPEVQRQALAAVPRHPSTPMQVGIGPKLALNAQAAVPEARWDTWEGRLRCQGRWAVPWVERLWVAWVAWAA